MRLFTQQGSWGEWQIGETVSGMNVRFQGTSGDLLGFALLSDATLSESHIPRDARLGHTAEYLHWVTFPRKSLTGRQPILAAILATTALRFQFWTGL